MQELLVSYKNITQHVFLALVGRLRIVVEIPECGQRHLNCLFLASFAFCNICTLSLRICEEFLVKGFPLQASIVV